MHAYLIHVAGLIDVASKTDFLYITTTFLKLIYLFMYVHQSTYRHTFTIVFCTS